MKSKRLWEIFTNLLTIAVIAFTVALWEIFSDIHTLFGSPQRDTGHRLRLKSSKSICVALWWLKATVPRTTWKQRDHNCHNKGQSLLLR